MILVIDDKIFYYDTDQEIYGQLCDGRGIGYGYTLFASGRTVFLRSEY